jgi:hypothetical protein
MTKPKQTW